jgi:hypothetical protein
MIAAAGATIGAGLVNAKNAPKLVMLPRKASQTIWVRLSEPERCVSFFLVTIVPSSPRRLASSVP